MVGVIYDQVGSLELSEMDRGERVEKMVDIYESADAFRVQETEDTSTVHASPAVRRRGSRCSRLAAVCLGLMCVLLLITNILLYMYYRVSFLSSITNLTEERDQLNISIQDLAEERNRLNISIQDLAEERDRLNINIQDLAEERDQLKISIQDLAEERDRLNISIQDLAEERDQLNINIQDLAEERDQLNISIQDLAEERDQLNISIQDLAEERDQLNISIHDLAEERDQLNISIQDLAEERDQLNISNRDLAKKNILLQAKYDTLVNHIKNARFKEWKKSGNSFYFFSTEQKTWSDARQDCRERRADLVIINSRDEQAFLIDQKKKTRFWIGLTKIKEGNEWKWVDDQPLTEEFWKQYESNDVNKEKDCAVFTTTAEGAQRTWNDLPCSDKENWVCELNLTEISSLNLQNKLT